MTLFRLHIQYEMKSRHQELRPVGLGHERIHGFQSILRQFHVLREHDDGDFWFDMLDLGSDDGPIQKAKVVLEHNCIHRPRHEEPQAFVTIARGQQVVSVFLQQTQLSRVPVYAQ